MAAASRQALPVLASHLYHCTSGPRIIGIGDELASTKQLLLDHPGCIYSGGRTVREGTRIFAFEQHAARLAKITLRTPPHEGSWLSSPEKQLDRCLPATRLALSTFTKTNPGFFHEESSGSITEREAKLMWLLTPDDELFVHVSELPAPAKSTSVEVALGTGHRHKPDVKGTDWAAQRVIYEQKSLRDGVTELVLADEHGNLFEGLQSNFFIINHEGRLITASADVTLAGTMQEVLLNRVVSGMPSLVVERRCPTVVELENCQAAFLSSTSRILLPITTIHIADDPTSTPSRSVQLPEPPPLLLQLRLKLIEQMVNESTSVE